MSDSHPKGGEMHDHSPELDDRLTDILGLEQTAAEYEAEAEQLMIKATALRQIVGAVKTLNGDAEAVLTRRFEAHRTAFEMRPMDEHAPRGPKGLLRIMREDPDRTWKVIDLKREMLRRGWAPTPKAVEASVKRLRAEGKLEPAGYGYYRLSPEPIEKGELGVMTP
jgi:hypothetical protein